MDGAAAEEPRRRISKSRELKYEGSLFQSLLEILSCQWWSVEVILFGTILLTFLGLCPLALLINISILLTLLSVSATIYWTLFLVEQQATHPFPSIDTLLFVLHWTGLVLDLTLASAPITLLLTALILRPFVHSTLQSDTRRQVYVLLSVSALRRFGTLFFSNLVVHFAGLTGLLLGQVLVTKVLGTLNNVRIRKNEVYSRPQSELPSILLLGPEEKCPVAVGEFGAVSSSTTVPDLPRRQVSHPTGPPPVLCNTDRQKMRRTSLPAALPLAIPRPNLHHNTTGGVDTALLLEAHGLVTDMLLDSAALPAHIVAGLKALATLLTPPPPATHYINPSNRPRAAPLTLSTDPDYTSDIDEIPYTGEKISTMPKRNSTACKKGVTANLLRRMSTSTWTTTTSATGMPTLEPQPNARRRRSASFRSAMEGTPGSSPTQTSGVCLGGGSGGPSHSQNLVHHHPPSLQTSHKSRSFSANALYASSDVRRRFSQQEFESQVQRKTVCSLHPLSPSDLSHLSSLAKLTGAVSPSSPTPSPGGTPLPSPTPSRDASPSNFPLPPPPSPTLPTTSATRQSGGPEFDQLSIGGRLGGLVMESGEVEDCSTTSTLGDGPGPPEPSISSGPSLRLSPVIFTLDEPRDDQPLSSASTDDDGSSDVICALDGIKFDLAGISTDPCLCRLNEWDYPIFDLEESSETQILSHMCYKVFLDVGLFEAFKIPIHEFINYFHALEMGYREKPYHNRMHAADVLHGVYYLTSQPIPGFEMQLSDPETPLASDMSSHRAWFNVEESSYGIMGANFPALELMALYTAAAMHDYDHPGRTNAFLVTTHAPQAILYNDRSVLENHHAAAAWNLLLGTPACNFLRFLDKAEFKRFRYLVIEAILATDLKRHFEILAEFNSKANEEDSVGIDWNQEADRLLVMEMCIKLADINGPCKFHDIHVRWTHRIAEEFYEQGDEEAELGLPISPYMDRDHPQLAKLQESFINHLVAPLCKAVAEAGILPGFWEEEDMEATGDEVSSCQETDNDNDSSFSDEPSDQKKKRKILCVQTKHLQDNHRHWMNVIKEETRKREEGLVKTESVAISTEDAMETIEEENNTPHSLNRSFSFEKEDSKL